MEKLVYLFEKGASADLVEVSRRILDCAREIDSNNRCDEVWINVWEGDPTVRALAGNYATPDRDKALVGSLSIWLDCLDDRAWIEERLRKLGIPFHGYLVTESVVREYEARDWPAGERSPGITLVAAFRKPRQLSDQEFYRRWHEGHSKLSLEIHPLWRYVRNAVARAITPEAPDFRAIVEERVRRYEDMEPDAFYRGKQDVATNDLATFVDFGGIDQMRIELMSEYILRQRPRKIDSSPSSKPSPLTG
ncbi:MAG: EthD domain [Deltaproteobacteria bacterium]|nr:EthD domain [Deltaproteobacteria bacterium]